MTKIGKRPRMLAEIFLTFGVLCSLSALLLRMLTHANHKSKKDTAEEEIHSFTPKPPKEHSYAARPKIHLAIFQVTNIY